MTSSVGDSIIKAASRSLTSCMIVLAVLALWAPFQVGAQGDYILDKIITDVTQRSPQFNIISKESEAEKLLNQTELSIFDLSGAIDGSYTDQRSPQTSPFSTQAANYLDYGLEFSKLWQSGFTTSVSYKVLDRENSFFNGASNSFMAPTLDFSVDTNIFQDLWGGRYDSLFDSVQEQNKALSLQNRIDKKDFLKELIKDFIDVYISRDEFEIQKSLCRNIRSQFKVLSKKRSNKIISKRDYLLGKKDVTSCQILIAQYQTTLLEQENAFKAQYFNPVDGYITKLQVLFSNIEKQVNAYKKKFSNFKIEDIDEIAALDREKASLEFKQKELEAQTKLPLYLGVSVGSTGLDATLTPANRDVTSLEFPYAKVNLRLDLPFVNRKVKSKAAANSFSLEAVRQKKELAVSEIQSDYQTVVNNISLDLKTQNKIAEKVQISKLILSEAQRDFKNGKIDYFELVEYQKNLLESQTELSEFRKNTIDRVIQFFDYSQYFNQFVTGR